jgi:hypothetical protein
MSGLGLSVQRTDPALLDAIAVRHRRIGLDGLLRGEAGGARRGRWTRVPARAATAGFRWDRRDGRDRVWWPQGIDLRSVDGVRIVAVSWYAQPRTAAAAGSRISFVQLRPGGEPRYWHVALVVPVAEAGGVSLRPVTAHAGGIAWDGDLLYVASTLHGLRVFDVGDIFVTRGDARAVLPQRERWAADEADADRLRFSFVSLDRSREPGSLLAGEYLRDDPAGRLVSLRLDDAEAAISHGPGLVRMQGATVVDDRWFVTTSEGIRTRGDLWVGGPTDLTRHRGVLPPGPEDIAHEPGTRILWSLSEHPGRRWVFAIDADAW